MDICYTTLSDTSEILKFVWATHFIYLTEKYHQNINMRTNSPMQLALFSARTTRVDHNFQELIP